MKRKEIAKKLGITIMAFMLAAPCAVPTACLADTKETEAVTEASADEAETLEFTSKTFKQEYKTEEGRLYKEISYAYPVAKGSSAAAQEFNKFYKSLLKKWKQAAAENLEDAKAAAAETEDNGNYYSDQVTYKITSNDGNYVSVLQSGYDYMMGAHGMPYRYSYIFDAKTGKKVSAANLLGMTKTQLNEKVRSLYLKKFDNTQKDGNYLFYTDRDDVKSTLDRIDFNKNMYYLKNGKIRFYVDPYAVGPYVAGFIEVAVKLDI